MKTQTTALQRVTITDCNTGKQIIYIPAQWDENLDATIDAKFGIFCDWTFTTIFVKESSLSLVKKAKPAKAKAKANGMELYTRNGVYHVRYRVANKFCTRQYFMAYLQAKLAILEELVVKLSSDLLKDISSKTWQQVITCLKSLYAKIDSISLQLEAIA